MRKWLVGILLAVLTVTGVAAVGIAGPDEVYPLSCGTVTNPCADDK